MGRITFTADEQHERIIDEVESERDVDSTAEAVRRCIERASRLQQREEELQQRVEELERDVERLENEKATLIQDREERTELVRYVKDERTWRRQPLLKRAKWWLFGAPEDVKA